MKNFIIYNSEKIIRVGKCKDQDFDLQAQAGESIMEGIADPNKNKIVDGAIVPYEPPIEYDRINRGKRNKLLSISDWTQLSDAPATIDKNAWGAYRQELRDITTHANWPNLAEADWPTPPSSL